MKKQQKRWFVVCMAACMVALFAAGCKNSSDGSGEPVAVEAIGLNPTTLSLAVGKTKTLTAIVKPDNASGAKVTWSSSKPEVATVGNDGTVTAVKVGRATIIAKAGEKEAECEVTVTTCNHYYEGGKCKGCGLQIPVIDGGTIDVHGDLTKYTGKAEELTIPEGVTKIDFNAFKNCKTLKKVTIPEGVTRIEYGAFEGCTKLESVTLPEGVIVIYQSVFSGCTSLKEVTIPDGVTRIESGTFEDCTSLAKVTIPASVTEIEGAFSGCTSLASVTIPDSVTEIGNSAFKGCSSLASVTIPDSVTKIGNCAFYGCSGLASVTIPDSVTEIEGFAFYGCDKLTTVNYGGTKAQWEAITGDGKSDLNGKTITVKCTDGDITVE